ncbi:aspartate--tRNA ligase [Collinsella sp. BIOML-A4]|uniref:aspartate--tRNA ligase n=1 Tax=unclassified Collinsella TaxID=2637548 RepID=UPI00136B9C52|nr:MULTISPECIES: aspartate--tRNA ligase [unclassified Collinsella]MZJ33702.1 aspartate--tRNA ligase [Collinsella sp. BIOML-A1]MZJ27850.1 aspartate--tRNA ligase [Collinsella sp. BIOML-A2]MZJ29861.1 aspartate--tRNA ligase [Collinsella sp. BIOML-A3]MZJ97445.1 aspartate--tRNA ligase [Collinsella sp. BIOML-A6]MZK31299.1 aspartate--tRNA ligase [Collinsella sp. BIOML-A5]
MSQTRPIDEHSMHTRTCGELRRENVGEEVTLTGWVSRRRDHGGLIFCDLRDREGITQLTFDPEHSDGDAFKIAETMRPEWPIKIHGVVRARGEETTNAKLATGEIEVLTDHAEVLNTSVTPPFQIEDGIETSEDTRLRYRYLDLRRPEMMANLKLRSDFTFAIREALHNREFMEVETPSLFKSTPEGARDFIVPSRIQPGNFYALPQSPQLLKQLLMVGGVERYYQVAKCFRDEDLRADRQPEFTQVDIEMAFVDQNDVISALEEVLSDAFGRMGVEMPTPLRRMDYWEAMDTYGSDKPDTRYGMHLVDLTDVFANSKFKVFATAANEEGSVVKAINAKGAGAWARAKIDKLAGVASTFGAKGLAWIAFREDGSINSPIVKFFSDEEMAALRERMDVEPGDLVMFAAGPRLLSDEILGGMRSHMANALEIKREGHDFLWVVNFPLFHWDEDRKAYAAEHQPFTLPTETDIAKIEADPLAAGSCTYDFVMDGFEAGGGGMRIHNAEMQMSMLKLLGFTEERAESQFGFLMEALKFGAPPMGGFALGLDRVCMLLAGSDSIRDVMAFPKTASGSDLMSGAPSAVSGAQLKDVSLRLM